jgi:hypothetical protein
MTYRAIRVKFGLGLAGLLIAILLSRGVCLFGRCIRESSASRPSPFRVNSTTCECRGDAEYLSRRPARPWPADPPHARASSVCTLRASSNEKAVDAEFTSGVDAVAHGWLGFAFVTVPER